MMAFEQTRHLAFFFGRVRCVCSLLRMCSGSQGGRSLEWLESGSVEARQRAAWPPKIRLMVGCGLKAPGARFFSVPSLPFLRGRPPAAQLKIYLQSKEFMYTLLLFRSSLFALCSAGCALHGALPAHRSCSLLAALAQCSLQSTAWSTARSTQPQPQPAARARARSLLSR
jgi:hypothetical protein